MAGKQADTRKGLGRAASAAIALGTVCAAAAIGAQASPSPDHPRTRRWYRRLTKPVFTPPDAAYGIGWAGVQAGLAYGGYRLMRRPRSAARDVALGLWGVNQAAIASWSAIFFGNRSTAGGTVAAGAMIGTAGAYTVAAAREDKVAGAVGVPLLGWVSFATLLAEEIWRRNGPHGQPADG